MAVCEKFNVSSSWCHKLVCSLWLLHILVILTYIWAVTCDFQLCGILTWKNSDEPVQPPFKLRNSKWCSVCSLTVLEYSSDWQRLWSDCAFASHNTLMSWPMYFLISWSFKKVIKSSLYEYFWQNEVSSNFNMQLLQCNVTNITSVSGILLKLHWYGVLLKWLTSILFDFCQIARKHILSW